jgi:hypothetical protein
MFKQFARPLVLVGLLLLGLSGLVFFLALYTGARFPSHRDEASYPTFPTRLPCTTVPDPLHPPVYPNALQVSVTPNPTHGWLEVMYTTSFLTTDDPKAVLAYYRGTMVTGGWFPEYQLSDLVTTPGTSAYGYPDSEVANMSGIIDVQGYAAFCNTTSAHPIRVAVVVRAFDSKRSQILLRVY